MQKSLLIIGAIALFMSAQHLMNNKELSISEFTEVQDLHNEWTAWKKTYGKSYSTIQEELYRFNVWMQNKKWIDENQGETYTLAVNVFSDLTKEEFKSTYLMQNVPLPAYEKEHEFKYDPSVALPTTVNWVTQGKTINVLNQGQCGSCWAFSAVESLDSAYAMIGTTPVPNYSEQQVVSCSAAYGNQGCNGGWPVNAYKYIQNTPLCTSAAYPYYSGTTELTGACKTSTVAGCTAGGSLTTYAVIPTGNCSALEAAVATQPISVCVDASTWSSYSSGIFNNCGTQLDHCVLAVGYNQGSYWLIQNSWSTSWGQSGFIQLAWGNTCGVCQQAQYPTAKPIGL